MHKTLSGKTEWPQHTRNTSWGKRGVNKRERKTPLPDESQPAFVHKKRRKKQYVNKPYQIWSRSKWGNRIGPWKRYCGFATAAERDAALHEWQSGIMAQWIEYKAVDREDAKAA